MDKHEASESDDKKTGKRAAKERQKVIISPDTSRKLLKKLYLCNRKHEKVKLR